MKKVKFKSTFRCAPEGHTVETFRKGDEKDLPDSMADSAVKSGAAQHVRKAKEPVANKAKKPADDKAKGSDGGK